MLGLRGVQVCVCAAHAAPSQGGGLHTGCTEWVVKTEAAAAAAGHMGGEGTCQGDKWVSRCDRRNLFGPC